MAQVNHIVQDETGATEFDIGDMLFDGTVGLACGTWGGNGASYGNSGCIMAAGKQLFKRGFFIRKRVVTMPKLPIIWVVTTYSNPCYNP